jgi:hypothetical protein
MKRFHELLTTEDIQTVSEYSMTICLLSTQPKSEPNSWKEKLGSKP